MDLRQPSALPTPAPAERWQERAARAVLLVVLYATPALICLRGAVVADGDLWWHLRSGQWIAQHHAFPHIDPFSRGAAGQPWAAYSWLFELLLLNLYQHWELVGVLACSTGIVVAITVALHRLLARLESDVTKAVLLTMAVMVCISPMFTPRPWLFTILFFTLEMTALMHARRTGSLRYLLWLPVIFTLWANIHIQFVDGLAVLGLAAIEATVERWRPLGHTRLRANVAWLALAGCLLSTLINPYGWQIYRVAHELASQSGVMSFVTELQAVPFRGFHDFLLLFLALGAAGTLARRQSLPLFETALLALAAVISFRSQRDVWLMAIVAGVVLAEGVGKPHTAQPRKGWHTHLVTLLIVLAACLVVFAGGTVLKTSNSRLRESVAAQMPVHAVEAIQARGYNGPLYNTYEWGGYLMWTLRQPVSIDGRAALQGTTRLERSRSTWFAEPGWSSDPELLSAGVIVAPARLPLAQVLRLDARFELVYEDAVAVIFLRRPH